MKVSANSPAGIALLMQAAKRKDIRSFNGSKVALRHLERCKSSLDLKVWVNAYPCIISIPDEDGFNRVEITLVEPSLEEIQGIC